jgi:hypothetical protein
VGTETELPHEHRKKLRLERANGIVDGAAAVLIGNQSRPK